MVIIFKGNHIVRLLGCGFDRTLAVETKIFAILSSQLFLDNSKKARINAADTISVTGRVHLVCVF